MKNVYNQGSEFGVKQSDKFEKPQGIDERWDCSSLQGFYNFGDVGSMKDNRPKVIIDNSGNQSVNDMLSSDNDTIDFGN